MSSNRRRATRMKAAAPQAAPRSPDADTIYRPELTGRDLDVLVNLIDSWVKHGGLQVVGDAMPLLQKVTAPRLAALAPPKE